MTLREALEEFIDALDQYQAAKRLDEHSAWDEQEKFEDTFKTLLRIGMKEIM